MPTPGDWVYVNNFKSPESPSAIYLRGGQGAELRDGMRDLVSFLIEQLPKAFRREDFDQERKALREKPWLLGLAAFLTTGGILLNRMNVVFFAMTLKGPMPQIAASTYTPSVCEWGVSVGLIAATIFLFGLGARLLPVLPAPVKA